MNSDRRDLADSEIVEDDVWGDSARNTINRRRDDGSSDRDDRDDAGPDDRRRRRVSNRMLSRDVRRDPWGGPPVQDVDELPSGYYVHRRAPRTSYDDRARRLTYPSYIDEETGGEAGLVNRAPEGVRSGYGPLPPRLVAEGLSDLDSPAEQRDANRFAFQGRSPRGYSRSDERILDDVAERLTEHGDLDASDVEVRVESGEVILAGTVEDRRAKRLAEDLAASVRGVRDVRNELRRRESST